MKKLRKTNLGDVKETLGVCMQCCGCFYWGPLFPPNALESPPPEFSPPTHKCPSFDYFKFKAYTRLGRGNLANFVFGNSQFPITDDLIKTIYTCTSCGMCSEICQVARQAPQSLLAIWALREELVQRGAPRPKPVEEMDANIEKSNNIFGAKSLPITLKGIPASGENMYFAGCVARFQKPEVTEATLEVLKAAGMEIAWLGKEEKCCGFVPGHDGNTQLLEEKADQNVEALKRAGAKRVIVSCAHCYKALKIDYPLIVGELPFEVVHIAELLAELIDEKKLRFTQETKRKVTYHDPCFLGRHCGVYNEPRRVLESIPGIELAEMERNRRWSYCCGSGAKITSSCYPEFTMATTKGRLLEGKEAADTIVTACTTCFSHMHRSARKEGMELAIYDLPVLVAEAMGIELSLVARRHADGGKNGRQIKG